MDYLFWNTNKKKNNQIIKDLIIDLDPTIVALAEYEDDEEALLRSLDALGKYYYSLEKIACNRINIITKYKPEKIEHFSDADHYTIKRFPYKREGQLVVFLHFPSKMYTQPGGCVARSVRLKNAILKDKDKSKISNIVVMGDFNMNPFEEGMVIADGFHAVSSRKIAEIEKRCVGGENQDIFYNPMWNMFGDNNTPVGTYYYKNSQDLCYFWNIFDQVIISSALIPYFRNDKLKIINNVNGNDLTNSKGIPNENISDHFPLFFSID